MRPRDPPRVTPPPKGSLTLAQLRPYTLAVDDYAPITHDVGEEQGIRLGIMESDEINATSEYPLQLFAQIDHAVQARIGQVDEDVDIAFGGIRAGSC